MINDTRTTTRARRKRRGAPERATEMLDLDVRSLWRAAKKQSAAFWALCFYVFIEYVRPQSIYTQFDVLPWGVASLATAVILAPFDSGRATSRVLPLEVLFWAFSGTLLLSILTSYAPSWGWESIQIYFNWVLLITLTVRLVNNPERFFIFFVLFLLWAFKMSQHAARSFASIGFRFRDWGATGGPGWFHNSGEFAVQMCVVLPMGLAWVIGMRRHWPRWKTWAMGVAFPLTAALGLVASSSRGGQLGGLAAMMYLLLRGRRRVVGMVGLVLTVGALWALLPQEQIDRFSAMGEDNTSVKRLTFWEDGIEIMNRYPLLGIGFESWVPYCRNNCVYPTLPHNIFVEAGAELGYTGLLLLVGMIVGCFVVNANTRKQLRRNRSQWGDYFRSVTHGLDGALVGYMVSGFFVTVLYYPFLWANIAFVVSLHLVVLRDSVARRREVMQMNRGVRRDRTGG